MTDSTIRVGFALTGSFCTFARIIPVIEKMVSQGFELTPVLSFNAVSLDTRFGSAASWSEKLSSITGRPPICTIEDAEPIGPKALFDVLAVAPCTGNTLAKLAHGITDTPVTMAVKSHLRGERPVVIGVSTNGPVIIGLNKNEPFNRGNVSISGFPTKSSILLASGSNMELLQNQFSIVEQTCIYTSFLMVRIFFPSLYSYFISSIKRLAMNMPSPPISRSSTERVMSGSSF